MPPRSSRREEAQIKIVCDRAKPKLKEPPYVGCYFQTGIDQLDRGEGIDGGTVLAELKQKSEMRRKSRKGK